MWGILVALLSGALMSLQGIFNTEVTKQSSIWAAAGWVQMTALVTCVVLYFVTGRGEIWGMFSIDRKYMLLGGVMGAFITWTVRRYLVSSVSRKRRLSGENLSVLFWRLRGSWCFGGSATQDILKTI